MYNTVTHLFLSLRIVISTEEYLIKKVYIKPITQIEMPEYILLQMLSNAGDRPLTKHPGVADTLILYSTNCLSLGPDWLVAYVLLYVLPIFLLWHKQMCDLCLSHPWRLTHVTQPAVTPLFFSAQESTVKKHELFYYGELDTFLFANGGNLLLVNK